MAKGWLRIAIEDFMETFHFPEWVSNIVKRPIEDIEQDTAVDLSRARSMLSEALEYDGAMQALLNDLLSGRNQGGALTVAGFATNLGMTAASGLFAPDIRQMSYSRDYKIRTARPDPAAAIAMYWRGDEQNYNFIDRLGELGWDETYIDAWLGVLRPRLSERELLTLLLRDELTLSQFTTALNRKGWREPDIQRIIRLGSVIPPIQDIISMAVREAFTPDAISRLQLGAEIPPEYLEWAGKSGLSDDWAKRYWYAHWRLPSLQMGFEMLHRRRPEVTSNPFTVSDMEALLKAQDISPAFREHIIDISYTPYTRVDTRRMYDQGVLDETGVYNSYRDGGYNHERAMKLTEWTVKQKGGTQKDLTRAAIVKAYKRGLYDFNQAKTVLVDIGFDDDEALFWLRLADLDIAEELNKEILDGIEFLYVEGQIDRVDATARIGQLGLPALEVDNLFLLWDVRREKKTRLPSRSELDDFYKKDIIDEGQYTDFLRKRGYLADTVEWYIQRLDIDILAEYQKDAERAAKENERLRLAELKSEYAVETSGIDVQIAELKLAIAERKLALHDITDTDTISQIKEDIDFAKVLIADLQVNKANVKHELEEDK